MTSSSSPPPAFTCQSILAVLASDTPSDEWTRLLSFASSGEIRDLDDADLWGRLDFYSAVAAALRRAWKAHDQSVLGGVSEDEHENFLYLEAQRRKRQAEGRFDDQEDEMADDEDAEAHASAAVTQAWTLLSNCYTFLARLLNTPEFQPAVACTRGALDATFAGQLMARFEPKFKRKGGAGNGPAGAFNLASVTGVGGVALGSASAASSGAGSASAAAAGGSKVPAQLAHVPASILSMVGIGVKYPDPDSPSHSELSVLRGLVHAVYSRLPLLRPTLRALFANFLQRFLRQSTYPQGVNEVLAIYGSIVRGFALPLHPQHKDFLLKHLLPLHSPNQMLNEMSPVLSVYHEALVYVLIQFLEKDNAAMKAGMPSNQLCEMMLNRILLQWPHAKAANSPKEVLMLHEVEKILEYCPVENGAAASSSAANGAAVSSSAVSAAPSSSSFHRILLQFLPYLVSCISSYNHRVSERALQIWQNDKFLSLAASEVATILPVVLPALVAEEKHWNRSVNKMRGIVLALFREMDLVTFTRIAHTYYLGQAAVANPQAQPTFTPSDSLARIDALIASLKPPEDPSAAQSPEAALLATQIRVAATLPQQVKYSDFVFGHLLGEGSFSQVRYAKWIQRGHGILPSSWPEFAVKILNKELVARNKYESNVAREISIMQRLVHENINRLVALCSNATNTYLVLEYAHRGDLHTAITTLGSLDVDSARFVSAEILRAMEEIHRNRIVFADLKPENVLVHKSGHIKLSDFGSSRFFDEVGAAGSSESDRLEGTADYLAPEVLRGAPISPASDLWAFACTLYQMLAGRTPIWAGEGSAGAPVPAHAHAPGSNAAAAERAKAAAEKHLSPAELQALRDTESLAHEVLQRKHMLDKMREFEESADEDRFPPNFDPKAKDLIERIMLPDPAKRIGVKPAVSGAADPAAASAASSSSAASAAAPASGGGVAWVVDYSVLRSHSFFSGLDFALLPTLPAPTFGGGAIAPAPRDAQWARRKNSIMWSPMPRSYEFKEGQVVMEVIAEDLAKETATRASGMGRSSGGKAAGSGSLRAQLIGKNKTGSLAAPRFGSLRESAAEDEDGGEEGGIEEASGSMRLMEGDEEEEEDDDESDEDEAMGGGMSGMRAAPMPSSQSLPPRAPPKASSRAPAGTAMAVVENSREEDAQDSATGIISLSAHSQSQGRAPQRLGGLGSKSHFPPPHPAGSAAAALPPSGARPAASFVPRADATAGPTGLGMGMRKMGGGSTASALLARVLNKPAQMHPESQLPDRAPPGSQ